eukprot:NODE_295_length_10520_cov_1.134344.p9 type:complete len:117 gc:universal NODE_295_length_10520_cov_1.134344:1662-1312(-)
MESSIHIWIRKSCHIFWLILRIRFEYFAFIPMALYVLFDLNKVVTFRCVLQHLRTHLVLPRIKKTFQTFEMPIKYDSLFILKSKNFQNHKPHRFLFDRAGVRLKKIVMKTGNQFSD